MADRALEFQRVLTARLTLHLSVTFLQLSTRDIKRRMHWLHCGLLQEKVNPVELFDAPVVKIEANPKQRLPAHLQKEAQGCKHLVLWLDCDREGENICFEVINIVGSSLLKLPPGQQQVSRLEKTIRRFEFSLRFKL